eukprot:TRINITY_DN10857_c0_g1_i3.p1 TRINITY_DN10857_c0_g1~~TRINITY_DN10857_c0_g1_i3.p1  ORF type:complete len:445 (+),score=86.85 TRINITY_DN10857_c0_g1_i3:72-1406(+)
MSGGEAVPGACPAEDSASEHGDSNVQRLHALLSSQSGLCRLWKLGILKLGDALVIEYPTEDDDSDAASEIATLHRSLSGYYLYCKPVRKKGHEFQSVYGFMRHVLSCSPPRQSLPKRHPLRVALCPKVTEEERLLNLVEHWVTLLPADIELSFWGRLHGRVEYPAKYRSVLGLVPSNECDEDDTGSSAARLSAVPQGGKGDSDSDSSDSSSTCGSLSSTHSSEMRNALGYQDEYPSSTDPSITDDSNPDSSVPSALAVESDLPVLQWPAKLSAANDLLESNALVQHLYDAHIVRGPCLDTLSLKISESISHTASIYCEYGCYCIAQGNAGLTPGKRLRWYTLTSWAMAVLGLSSDVKARQVVRHLLHRSTLYGERVVLVPHLKSLSIEKYGPIKKKGGEGKDGAAEDTPEQGAASEVGGGDAPPSKKRRKDDDEPVLPCQGEYE